MNSPTIGVLASFADIWRAAVVALLLLTGVSDFAVIAAESNFEEHVKPLLQRFCFECHSKDSNQGNVTFDQFGPHNDPLKDRVLWWKVLKNLRSGVMPPAGEQRPTPDEQSTIGSWIKFDVLGINPQDIDPGGIGVRRLNRREYENTVNELMGIRFDAALTFPPDDSGYGFDNVGEALSFSPLLMEKYLRTAQMIVDQAVPKVTWIIPRQEFTGRDFTDNDKKIKGDNLSSKKPAAVKRSVKVDEAGMYDVQVDVKLHGSFDFDPSRYSVVFCIDGQERSTNEYGWDENKLFRYQFAESWQAGEHELEFKLTPVVATTNPDENAKIAVGVESTSAHFEIHSVRIIGPRGTSQLVHPARYSRFFSRNEPPMPLGDADKNSGADTTGLNNDWVGGAGNNETAKALLEARRQYADEILSRFATRAFRGRVDRITVERLVMLAERVYQQPEKTFEAGIAHAIVAVLASPRFLFRLESIDSQSGGGQFPIVDELSLASRLSYFLWSSMPDDELFRLAQAGDLRKQLPQQLRRMMGDEHFKDFVRNFVGQWLRTRDVTQVSVDPIVVLGHQEEYEKLREQFRSRRRAPFGRDLSPEDERVRKRFGEFRAISDRFNDEMKRSMRRETEMAVEYIVKEDRSLLDLLDCNYTFVNDKLGALYGIPNVRGNEMRMVTLPEGSPRGGVLTHASMLLVTSNPTRTSPVKRGLFVLENILGTPAPPAPAGVPDLEESAKKFAGKDPPLRELLAAHRESALCSSCHSRMDPLGIALENFNALGMWRDQEKEQPIDASGQLITGEAFRDVRDLKKILRQQHATDFYRCVTEKMLTYALGRGPTETDEQTIDLIVTRLNENEGRFSSLMQGVIDSAPFQKQRRGNEP